MIKKKKSHTYPHKRPKVELKVHTSQRLTIVRGWQSWSAFFLDDVIDDICKKEHHIFNPLCIQTLQYDFSELPSRRGV